MTTIDHVHASLKHNADPRAVGRYIRELVEVEDATKVTTTETNGAMQAQIREQLLDLDNQWWVRREGEYLIAGRRDVLRPGDGRLVRLSHQYDGSQAWRDLYVHLRWASVVHEGGVRSSMLTSAGHKSSAVQHGDSWSGFARGVASHQIGSARWGRRLQTRDDAADDRDVELTRCAAFDGNLDYHLARWRTYENRVMRMPGIWDDHQPHRGTHAGGRLIDTIHTDAQIVQSNVVDVEPHTFDRRLDHRAIHGRYRIPAPKLGEYEGTHTPTPWRA